ncbi:MAG: response regulator [Calditrichaeota bacterium]|nr:MAG: response regulator [Calditrichota bacterium]
MYHILWADDEIELLQPHVRFLESREYRVTTVTNGDDALAQIDQTPFDLVLLDETMPGKDGLTTLNEIKDAHPQIPVIMITKNEEESLMEEAIGKRIDDYLTKPVNPSQILMACKKILQKKNILNEKRSQAYATEISRLSMSLMSIQSPNDWVNQALKIFRMDMELDTTADSGFRDVLYDQRKESNKEFGRFVEKNYERWVRDKSKAPRLSVDVVPDFVMPRVRAGQKTILIIIDCMRLDQWFMLEPFFYERFNVTTDYLFSILPTATPFSRNAIFSGLFPVEIEKRYPELWSLEEDDESLNRYEKELLELQFKRHRLPASIKYVKIMNNEDARQFDKNLDSYMDSDVLAVVINFVDILAHSRSDLPILKEIAPNEAAYRSLTKSWFEHSPFVSVFDKITNYDADVIITSDHGSVRCLHDARVIGDRDTSTSLRYKYGRSLKADKKHAVYIGEPERWKLPRRGVNTTYVIAKEDYYFVYPTNYHRYQNQYKDSFQHGGISMEEVILPVITLKQK